MNSNTALVGICFLVFSPSLLAASGEKLSAEASKATAPSESLDEPSGDAVGRVKRKKTRPIVQRQTPPEVANVEHWFKEVNDDNWREPSHMYLSFTIEGDHVCGLLFSSAMGTNRLDRSLLIGKVISGHIEVRYASSYYSDQDQVAIALLERRGDQLHWQPTGKELPSSWFWGGTLLSHTEKPYVPLTKEDHERCIVVRNKKSIDASDLHHDP